VRRLPPPALILGVVFSLNLILFVFNLIPLPPLDGSGMLNLVLSPGASEKYANFIHNPAFLYIGMFLAWKLIGLIFGPIHTFAVCLLYPGVTYN
jgi:Zn-dependent protease